MAKVPPILLSFFAGGRSIKRLWYSQRLGRLGVKYLETNPSISRRNIKIVTFRSAAVNVLPHSQTSGEPLSETKMEKKKS